MKRLLLALALLLSPALAHAQTYTITPTPFQTAFDNSGAIINNACVWTYAAGTTTAATTYSANTGTTNTNPIRSDPAGRFTAYLIAGNTYKFVYESACTPPAHGTVLRTADNIAAVPASAANVDLTGTAGEAIAIGLCAYLSAGDGGKTSGLWYKCDSANTYSSTTKWVGLVPSAIASGASGTIRLEGSVTGLAVAAGSDYYVGTAGAITATAPANVRKLGQADTTTSLVLTGNPPPPTPIVPRGCDIRLTLTSGTPVTTADVTAAATIYATPYVGQSGGPAYCAFYDGTATWTTLAITEVSIALGTITSALPYDIFCYSNAGVFACDAPLAWTNTTTRATALTTQNGVYVKTGATTRRYIGTFQTTSTTTTEDSFAKRLVWNYYNRVARPIRLLVATDTWTYTTNTWRQANADTANQVAITVGVAEDLLHVHLTTNSYNTNATVNRSISIGESSTTTPSTSVIGPQSGSTGGTTPANEYIEHTVDLMTIPAAGYSYYVWLEKSGATGTTTWVGDGGDTSLYQCGFTGMWKS